MRVIITGASSGIGLALAAALGRAGARLALCARGADRLAAATAPLPGVVLTRAVDVADPAALAAFLTQAAAALGGIDTLVCNAGFGLVAPVAETSLAQWQALLATNLLGTAAAVQAVVPVLRAQPARDGWRGQIVIVSSALARRSRPDAGAYSATKAAQLALAEALRVELAPAAIAVTSVHPVGTATAFQEGASARGGRPWRRAAHEPLQSPEEVARAIVRAIQRPRPEVWPHRWSRWALSLATACPGLVDRLLARRLPPPDQPP